jgi:hypothetical protein
MIANRSRAPGSLTLSPSRPNTVGSIFGATSAATIVTPANSASHAL